MHKLSKLVSIAKIKKAQELRFYLSSFPESNPRPVSEIGLNGDIRYLNPAIKRLFPGIEKSGKNHPWFADLKSQVMHAFRKKKNKFISRELAIGKSYFEQAIAYIPQEKCIRIYGQKITKRKNEEKKLLKNRNELEQEVAQRTAELMKAQTELMESKRLSDIGALGAIVAHELRNPLAAIGMAAANIRRKANNPLLDSHLNNIEKKIYESDQIINNLLFYSKIKVPHRELANILGIVEECIEAAKRQFSKAVLIKKRIGSLKNISIEVDPLQIREVFQNILNNAYDAIHDLEGSIEIKAQMDEKEIKVSFKDSGIGIENEYLDKIFEPFFTTKAKGTGLGLSVCQQIVNLHGGSIFVESQIGKGTIVTVSLPRKAKAENPNEK
jgi:signal transduction histidine kinase